MLFIKKVEKNNVFNDVLKARYHAENAWNIGDTQPMGASRVMT